MFMKRNELAKNADRILDYFLLAAKEGHYCKKNIRILNWKPLLFGRFQREEIGLLIPESIEEIGRPIYLEI